MYFTGTLSIDPSQITEVQRVKPTRAFGKLFYYLSAGRSGDEREVEANPRARSARLRIAERLA